MSDSVTLLMTAIPFPYRGLDKEYNTEMASHHPRPKPWHKSYKSHHISHVLKNTQSDIRKCPWNTVDLSVSHFEYIYHQSQQGRICYSTLYSKNLKNHAKKT